jgi:hypothetical protein
VNDPTWTVCPLGKHGRCNMSRLYWFGAGVYVGFASMLAIVILTRLWELIG